MMPNPLKLFYMAVWRNFLTLRRYKVNFLFSILTSAVFGLGMLVFAALLNTSLLAETVGSANYIAFLILGFSYQAWQGVALWDASNIFQGELSTGQIDYTFSCPFSRYWYIVSNIAASAVQEAIFFIPVLCVGFWFTRATLTMTGIALGLAATIVSVAALAQLGAIFASLVLRFRQVTAIFGFFNISFQIFTGMFIPIQLLPAPIQLFGQSLPQTFGIDLLRHYVMGTRPIMLVEYEWLMLLIQLAVLAAIAKLVVLYLEREGKKQGLHYI